MKIISPILLSLPFVFSISETAHLLPSFSTAISWRGGRRRRGVTRGRFFSAEAEYEIKSAFDSGEGNRLPSPIFSFKPAAVAVGRSFGPKFISLAVVIHTWGGIQWRADLSTIDFKTYPNYQKLIKFTVKSPAAAQILRAHIASARH